MPCGGDAVELLDFAPSAVSRRRATLALVDIDQRPDASIEDPFEYFEGVRNESDGSVICAIAWVTCDPILRWH